MESRMFASSLFSNKLRQYVVETSAILSWYHKAILDRLPNKFMKVQMRIQELCHV